MRKTVLLVSETTQFNISSLIADISRKVLFLHMLFQGIYSIPLSSKVHALWVNLSQHEGSRSTASIEKVTIGTGPVNYDLYGYE